MRHALYLGIEVEIVPVLGVRAQLKSHKNNKLVLIKQRKFKNAL